MISRVISKTLAEKNKQNVQKNCACTVRHRRCNSPRELQGLLTEGLDLVCPACGTETEKTLDYLARVHLVHLSELKRRFYRDRNRSLDENSYRVGWKVEHKV